MSYDGSSYSGVSIGYHSEFAYSLKNIDYEQIMGIERDSIVNAIKRSDNSHYSYYSSASSSASSSFSSSYYNGTTVTDKPTGDFIKYANLDTDAQIVSESEYTTAVADKEKAIAAYTKYITDSTDPFFTDELKTELITNFASDTNNYWGKKLDIMYYQGKYEETGNTTWLDKKKQALNELNSYETVHNYYNLNQHINTYFKSWYKENISDIENKNRITTKTLTSELEKALGISKDAVTQKEQELAALKKQAEQAKTNYENVAPTQQDTYLSGTYTEVMENLEKKAAELKRSQERLAALKEALTLNDFTDVGENAMAVGTDSLATGKNSMAVGTSAIATGENAIAVGNGAIVTGKDSIAIGTGNVVLGEGSGAIGDPNTIYASRSYALGNNNTIGAVKDDLPDATVGLNTFVLGNYVTTTANNSVILGNASADNGENDIVSVGSSALQRKIIYVANGTENTDAATYGQLVNAKGVTTKTTEDGVEKETTTYTPYEADSDGIVTVYTNDNQVAFTFKTNPIGGSDTSASGGGASSAALTAEVKARENLLKADTDETIRIGGGTGGTKIDVSNSTGETRVITGIQTDPTDGMSAANVSYVNTVYNKMQSGMSSLENRLTEDNRTVGAVSAALAGLKPMAYTPEDKWGFAAATGTYRGTTATALGVFYQPNEDVLFNLGSTVGADHNAWNAGFSVKFGRKTARSIPKGDTATQLAALRKENEKLRRDIEEMRAKHDADMQSLSAKIAALVEKVR